MKIYSKILLALGGTAMVMIVILYAVSTFIVERRLLQLEEENVRFRLNQLSTEFEVDAANLDAVNRDWASWDETYGFVGTTTPEVYIAENISDDVFKYLRLNLFSVFTTHGQLFYYYFSAPDHGPSKWSEEDVKLLLTQIGSLPGFEGDKRARVGFMLLGSSPVLVSEREILKSDFSGPPQGRLSLGRIIDGQVIKSLENKHGINITLRPLDKDEAQGPEFNIISRSPSLVAASLVIKDISGQPALLLIIEQPRNIFKTGWGALKSYALIIALITFAFAGLMVLFINKLILKRLWQIFNEIDHIIETESFGDRLKSGAPDEFGTLATNINHLLESLSAFESEKTDRQIETMAGRVLSGSLIFTRHNLVYCNEEQARINGPIKLGLSFTNYLTLYIHPFDRNFLQDLYKKAEKEEDLTSQSITIRCFKFPGQYQGEPSQKWVQATAYNFTYQNQPALLLNMIDITKAKSLEQILLSREKMTSLGHVAAGIAHEIRNPLMGIGLTIDNLRDYFRDNAEDLAPLSEMLDQAREATLNISLVIERVLDFARSGDPCLSRTIILAPVETAIKLSRALAKKLDVTIEVRAANNLPEVLADSPMLVEVFVNLISNSIQAMADQPQAKKITITLNEADQMVEIKIRDSGPGIKAQDAANLFEPFFTTKEDGSGLGLSICRRIITDHGGTIELEFPALSGAAFLITLPVAEPEKP